MSFTSLAHAIVGPFASEPSPLELRLHALADRIDDAGLCANDWMNASDVIDEAFKITANPMLSTDRLCSLVARMHAEWRAEFGTLALDVGAAVQDVRELAFETWMEAHRDR